MAIWCLLQLGTNVAALAGSVSVVELVLSFFFFISSLFLLWAFVLFVAFHFSLPEVWSRPIQFKAFQTMSDIRYFMVRYWCPHYNHFNNLSISKIVAYLSCSTGRTHFAWTTTKLVAYLSCPAGCMHFTRTKTRLSVWGMLWVFWYCYIAPIKYPVSHLWDISPTFLNCTLLPSSAPASSQS